MTDELSLAFPVSEPETKKQLKKRNESTKIASYAIFGDFLFILLPLIVLSIVEISKGETISAVLESAEWTFGAAVLFGQSITKLVAGFSRTKPETWEKPVFNVSFITVVGLVPTLTVLALLLALNPVPHTLKLAQLPIFIIGTIVFFCCGIEGHTQCHTKVEEDNEQCLWQ